MAEQIQLEIVTPKGAVFCDKVDIVTGPGHAGEFGVLANHAPMLSTIKIGVLSFKQGTHEEFIMVSGGFCEVSNNKITFLVEAAELGEEIDVERALRAKERAEKRLAEIEQKKAEVDRTRAETALQRALARIKAVKQRTS